MTQAIQAPAQSSADRSSKKPLWVGDLGLYVRNRVKSLSRLYLTDTSEGVKAVAQLSRMAGTTPERGSLETLKWTIDGLPDGFIPADGSASRDELAAYGAITLFALQQHSNRERSVQDDSTSFAAAVGRLYRDTEQEGILRRFNAALTAVSWEENQTYLRSLVQFLRKTKSAIDYGKLAEDLRDWQVPTRQDRIRLAWGRDFYRLRTQPSENAKEPAQQASLETD